MDYFEFVTLSSDCLNVVVSFYLMSVCLRNVGNYYYYYCCYLALYNPFPLLNCSHFDKDDDSSDVYY